MRENQQIDLGARFEATMRLYFGKTAYGVAGLAESPKEIGRWTQRCARHILKSASALDTSERHRDLLMRAAAAVEDAVGTSSAASWPLVLELLDLVALLLGVAPGGQDTWSPCYWQTPTQYYGEVCDRGGDNLQQYKNRTSILAYKRRLIQQLLDEGLPPFTAGLVLNISEYQVRKLLKESPV
jgi:hypothetical protein